ncbi:response regulator [bacterium]|nr:response regulator [bacterium]MCI0611760.1 response regulator [bacterium]
METKIYLVEDDPSVRKGLQRLLNSIGFNVETFASAEEFLQSEIQQSSSCLILDINLGEMNGFGLQKQLSENGSTMPVIFITAFDDEHTHRKMLKAGVPFLIKPFADQKLIDLLRSVEERLSKQ